MTLMHSRSASAGLIIGCIIFGLGSLIVAHVDMGAWSMAFWRLAISGVVFTILAMIAGQRLPQSSRAIIYGLLSGAFLGLDLALWHESIYAIGPGISTLLNSLQIFFLAAIGFYYFNERQSILQLISLCLAVLGVAMIGSPEFVHNEAAAWGFISGILSGAMLAASMTFIRKTHDTEATPIFVLMQLVSIGGVISMIVPMFIFDMGYVFDLSLILPNSWSDLGWILIYGIVMQCLAWGLIAYSIPKLSLALTGLLLLTEPVAALVIDYTWLDKPINLVQWVGALLTMFAIYLGALKPKKRILGRYRFFAKFSKHK